MPRIDFHDASVAFFLLASALAAAPATAASPADAANQVDATLSVATRYQSNATAGPPGSSGLAPPGGASRPDGATVAFLNLNDSLYFGEPGQSSSFDTSATVTAGRQFDLRALDALLVDATAGPRFRLDGLGLPGASVRPYGKVTELWRGGTRYDQMLGGGLSWFQPWFDRFNTTFTVEERQVRFFDSDLYPGLSDRSGVERLAQLALRVPLSSSLVWGFGANYLSGDATETWWSRQEFSASTALTYTFDPLRNGSPWTVSAGISRMRDAYGAPDPSGPPGVVRTDDEWRVGLTNSIPLHDGLSAFQQFQWKSVASNVPQFSLTDFAVTLGLSSRIYPAAATDPPPHRATAPTFNWTGCYLGANIGTHSSLTRSAVDYPPPNAAVDEAIFASTVATIGGQGGCAWQPAASSLVFGIEGDVSWQHQSDSGTVHDFGGGDHLDAGASLGWQGSVRGRAGFAFGRSLVYATGGIAFGTASATTAVVVDGVGSRVTGAQRTLAGWTLGGGIEVALKGNWSGRVEYRYSDFGRLDIAVPAGNFPASFNAYSASTRFGSHDLRLGLNYRFNWGR